MQVHRLEQGSPEWHQHRAKFFNASDAPAMMAESPYKSRDQLLHEMHTGITPEVPPALQLIYDEGHRAETLARPEAELIIGDDLYPVVGSEGKLSASFDGLTLDRKTAFEHKLMNNTLRGILCAGGTGADLPMVYRIQMQQQMMVSGAERVLFVASKWDDQGRQIEFMHCWYEGDEELAQRICAGWRQFETDLADYRPPVKAPKTAAEAIESLPALMVQIEGRVLQTNLPRFKEAADEFIAGINTDLQSDQDFANAEAQIKFCSEAEKKLARVKDDALGQTASIDELYRTIDSISEGLRAKRLELDKLVKTRKDEIRTEIVRDGLEILKAHRSALNAKVGGQWIEWPSSAPLAAAIKGKRTVDTIRAAVNDKVAAWKVEMTERAERMLANHQSLVSDAHDYSSLFPDFAEVGDRDPEDFAALLFMRQTKHKQAQEAIKPPPPPAAPPVTQIAVAQQPDGVITVVSERGETTVSTGDSAADVLQRVSDAVIGAEKLIRDFVSSRQWGSERDAQKVRAILVEYEKFRASAGAKA